MVRIDEFVLTVCPCRRSKYGVQLRAPPCLIYIWVFMDSFFWTYGRPFVFRTELLLSVCDICFYDYYY